MALCGAPFSTQHEARVARNPVPRLAKKSGRRTAAVFGTLCGIILGNACF